MHVETLASNHRAYRESLAELTPDQRDAFRDAERRRTEAAIAWHEERIRELKRKLRGL